MDYRPWYAKNEGSDNPNILFLYTSQLLCSKHGRSLTALVCRLHTLVSDLVQQGAGRALTPDNALEGAEGRGGGVGTGQGAGCAAACEDLSFEGTHRTCKDDSKLCVI